MLSNRNGLAALVLRFGLILAVVAVLTPAAFASLPAPVPIITFISPVSAVPGGAQFTLTVNGAGFVTGAVVDWNTTALVTVVVNSDKLTATVPATLIATAGTGWITVTQSGQTSNVFYFTVQNAVSTFTAAELTATVGSNPYVATEGDFNGDGVLDLAVSNFSAGTVSVLLGNGDGTFQTQKVFSTLADPFGMAVGDLNGDGIPDLVVGNVNAGLNIALGNGDGTFTVTAIIGGNCLQNPVLADVNHDGKLDIIVGNACGTGIEVYLGNGNGTFQTPTVISGSSASWGMAVADFNGDGNLDLATTTDGASTIDIYIGNGNGTFGAVTHITGIPEPIVMAVGDLNGDGKVDIVYCSAANGGIEILYGNGNGTFSAPASVISTGTYISVATGDLNGDGALDIVGVTDSGTLQVWFAAAGNTFAAPETIGNAGAVSGYGLVLGNFAIGGGLDIADANPSTNQVVIFVPTVVISPSSNNFGSVGVGSSVQQIFTITNDTPSTVTISGVTFTGANPGDFTEQDACSTPVVSGGTCSVTVTFAPGAAGARSAILSIADTASTSPQTASLTGTGVAAPVATLSTAALAFGNQAVGVTSASQPVTITNTGSAALTGLVVSVIGTNPADFLQTNTCTGSLAIGAFCTINVTFTPGALGARSASLQFADNAANTPQLVTLGGTGVLATAANLLYMAAPPASVMAGSSIGTISVGVYTAQSVLVTSSTAGIQVTITGPNAFSQSLTEAAVSGVATFNFNGVALDAAGQYAVTAASAGLTSAVATTIVAAQGSSAQMLVTGYPSPAYSNVPHTFTVIVTDAFGNPITTYTGTVTLNSSDPSAVLTPSPYTYVSADMGAHTFTATLITLGTQSISATDGTLAGSQTGIQVNARPQFVVNTLADDSGTSLCSGGGTCSLRSAINQANALGAGDITVNSSQFEGGEPFTSTLTNGVLELSSNINITGPGEAQVSVSGNAGSSVFQVDAGAIATINSLSATDGSSGSNGGAITNAGTLTLSNVGVTNSTSAQNGGGIYSTGTLTMNSSEVTGNTASGNGGGVANTGTFVSYDSTISGNTATGNGGGIDNSSSLSVPQSTFSGNTATDGAGIENEAAGMLTLVQSTLSGNTATSQNGGTVTNLNGAQGSVTILNGIDAGNTAAGGDCVNCGTQSSFNLFNVATATLNLGPLANNGGPTQTMLPLTGSTAIGTGSTALALNPGVPQPLTNDQRGVGFIRIVDNSVDLGAVQANSGPAESLVLEVSGTAVAGNALVVTVTALTASGNPAGSYAGTVSFGSSDPEAILPEDYTFVPADDGTHVFSITLQTSGTQTITVIDTGNASLQATQSISESPAAAATISVVAGSGQTAVVGAAFATSLAASVNDAFGNGVADVTVTFTAPSSGASGTFAGSVSSASAQTTSTGIATAPAFTANTTVGQYSVTATTTGLTAVSIALTNVVQPGYTLSANPSALTIIQGQSGTTAITITPTGGFAGTLNLGCTGLPANSNCVFSPPTGVLTGNNLPITIMLTVNTTGTNGALSRLWPGAYRGPSTGSNGKLFAPLAGLLGIAMLGWSTTWKKRPRYALAALALVLVALAGAGLSGCGTVSGGNTQAATVPGTYPVSVAATVGNSGTQTELVTITIVKQ